MSRRVVIITELIAPYRIPVFNALACCPGVDLHVIFLAETDLTQRHWLVYKDEIRFSYEVLPSWRRKVGQLNLLLNRGVRAALRRAAPDVIVCGGYNYVASWNALRWAQLNGAHFFLWVESTAKDLRKNHRWVESLKERFLSACDGFVVPGKSSRDYLLSYGVPDERIFTAPNAVDTEFFSTCSEMVRKSAAESRKRLGLPARFFLFVGRLLVVKGVFDLLDAYEALTPKLRREIGLVFVGTGPAEAELRRRAVSITPGSIVIAGFVQREQLPAFYALANVFVFPTHSDPWGLVVNEAMACGLPVICSSAAGCGADLVKHGWTGRIVGAGDVDELASTMNELTRDAEQRSRMGQRGQKRILQYSPEAWAAAVARAIYSAESHKSSRQAEAVKADLQSMIVER